MPNESLIVKYRPQLFKEVIGQPNVVKSLISVLDNESSHAFLFMGPSGTGKTTLARLVANELGATNPGDIIEHDAGQFTGIEDVRNLVSTLKYKPVGGSTTKAIILNEAHRLTIAAQDALLTSLEDCPDHVYWFFTTTEGIKIRAAIKTRCSSYELKSVSNNLLFDLLTNIADAEHFSCSDTVLELCVKEANGSPRQAIANLGICADIEDRKEAATLLKAANYEGREAVELCRALLRHAPWPQVMQVVAGLEQQNAESVRHVVRAYITKALIDSKDGDDRSYLLLILDCFMTPFSNYDGVSPLVLAAGRIYNGE